MRLILDISDLIFNFFKNLGVWTGFPLQSFCPCHPEHAEGGTKRISTSIPNAQTRRGGMKALQIVTNK